MSGISLKWAKMSFKNPHRFATDTSRTARQLRGGKKQKNEGEHTHTHAQRNKYGNSKEARFAYYVDSGLNMGRIFSYVMEILSS